MGTSLFTCPSTNLKVQHWLDDDEDVPETEYEAVTCQACGRLHLINRKSGRLLGRQDHAQDRTLTVFAAASLMNALDDINAAYTARTGVNVAASYAASSLLACAAQISESRSAYTDLGWPREDAPLDSGAASGRQEVGRFSDSTLVTDYQLVRTRNGKRTRIAC